MQLAEFTRVMPSYDHALSSSAYVRAHSSALLQPIHHR